MSRTCMLLFIMMLFLIFPLGIASSQEKDSPSNSAPIKRVDGTDFPTLYLATPQLQGDAVWMVQARLRELGYEIEPDGIFSQNTCNLIKMFQLANNLQADGRVTHEVWVKLMDEETVESVLNQPPAKGRISIEIDLIKHSLTVYEDRQIIKKFAVGVGKSSTPSPLGEWKVVQKSLNWGNGFGTRWMGLNVPWGIYGVHGTNKPYSIGQSMSHGCIRMQNRDVEALYPLVSVGTPVKIVANGQMVPPDFKPVNLQYKSYGQQVVYLQSRLKERGIIFDKADGRYGKMTELAVKYYQIWHGLNPTGKPDLETYRSLGMIK